LKAKLQKLDLARQVLEECLEEAMNIIVRNMAEAVAEVRVEGFGEKALLEVGRDELAEFIPEIGFALGCLPLGRIKLVCGERRAQQSARVDDDRHR
jgi:hypothetical protein